MEEFFSYGEQTPEIWEPTPVKPPKRRRPSREGRAPKARQAGKRVRVKYSNKTKVMICYLLCWALALSLPLAALVWVYPYTLVGTAPKLAENLGSVVPAVKQWLGETLAATAPMGGASSTAMAQATAERDLQWRIFLAGCFAAAWLISLAAQLVWRSLYRHPFQAARTGRRAVHTYRVTLLVIAGVNAAGALLVYFLGMRFISGKTHWDWLLYMDGFALNLAAAWICFRWAAPPAISGKHAFFKRL